MVDSPMAMRRSLLAEAYNAWTGTLEKVFKTVSGETNDGPSSGYLG